MQKLTISLMLAAIIFILGFSTYAAFPEEAPTPKKITWQKRLKQREQEFMNMQLRVDKIYAMVSQLYLKRFGQKKYNDLIWSEEREKDK